MQFSTLLCAALPVSPRLNVRPALTTTGAVGGYKSNKRCPLKTSGYTLLSRDSWDNENKEEEVETRWIHSLAVLKDHNPSFEWFWAGHKVPIEDKRRTILEGTLETMKWEKKKQRLNTP